MKSVIAIGKQNFQQIREHNCFYIDKTNFIKEWWESEDDVTLITLPRRFGKTLNMSMIEIFFSNKYFGRTDLFEGLSIWREKKYRNLQGTYPVVFLSFSGINTSTWESARAGIIQKLVKLYSDYAFLEFCGKLDKKAIDYFHSVDIDMNDTTASVAIHYLTDYLSRYYGKKVIVLLDEYDVPMQEAYVNGYWNKMAAFIRSLFNLTFKTNPYLERGLMTGITRVSKESIFSDLNNLKVVTTTSEQYADSFGFTEKEVFLALDQQELSDDKEKVKQWYDGFQFGTYKDIYNPWSITNFLDTTKFAAYWANTSTNSLVSKLIMESSPEIKIAMEDLLEGKPLITYLDEEIVFNQLEENDTAIWSLLLASGYLKAVKSNFQEEIGKTIYYLKITNQETLFMFRSIIEGWFHKSTIKYNNFIKALLLHDTDSMNDFMNDIALQSFSFFDAGKNSSEKAQPERFYHGFVLGLIVELANKYHISSNRESGFGRYDIVLEPIQNNLDAIIIEFKVYNQKKEKDLQDTVNTALAQIKEKNYDANLLARGITKNKIYHYGFAFKGKEVLIGSDR